LTYTRSLTQFILFNEASRRRFERCPGVSGQPESRTAQPHTSIKFQQWFNIVDLRPQPPPPPLPSVLALFPVPETFQIVSNKFYNRLHVLLTATLLGTCQHSLNVRRLSAPSHFTTVMCGVDFDYHGRSRTTKTSCRLPPPSHRDVRQAIPPV